MKKLPFAELTAVLEVSGSRAPAGAGDGCESEREDAPLRAQGAVTGLVLPPLSVGKITLRLYAALNYSQNRVHDLRRALNGA